MLLLLVFVVVFGLGMLSFAYDGGWPIMLLFAICMGAYLIY
jgi:hypothetical protein